jgi:hypothetical protein
MEMATELPARNAQSVRLSVTLKGDFRAKVVSESLVILNNGSGRK